MELSQPRKLLISIKQIEYESNNINNSTVNNMRRVCQNIAHVRDVTGAKKLRS